jgi:hypothetical protein
MQRLANVLTPALLTRMFRRPKRASVAATAACTAARPRILTSSASASGLQMDPRGGASERLNDKAIAAAEMIEAGCDRSASAGQSVDKVELLEHRQRIGIVIHRVEERVAQRGQLHDRVALI